MGTIVDQDLDGLAPRIRARFSLPLSSGHEVPEVDVEPYHASCWKQIAPDCEARILEDAELSKCEIDLADGWREIMSVHVAVPMVQHAVATAHAAEGECSIVRRRAGWPVAAERLWCSRQTRLHSPQPINRTNRWLAEQVGNSRSLTCTASTKRLSGRIAFRMVRILDILWPAFSRLQS